MSVDLSDCVDDHGFPTHEARQRIWHTLVASPAGVSVEIRLGSMKWLDEPTRRVLVDAGAAAGEIVLVSSDPEVLHHEFRDLRWYFTEAAS